MRTKLSIALAGVGAGLLVRNLLRKSRERSILGDVVLITGGSRGLGLALARRFAAEGCEVAICARDNDELARAKSDLSRSGLRVLTVMCDVTNRSDVEQMVQDVTAKSGPIDIVVNNAGQIKVGPLDSMTLDDFAEAMDVMFWGTVYPTLTVLPSLIARNSGHVVNITSIGGKVAVPHLLPYTAAKSAAVGFSEGLRADLTRRSAVRVTTVVPGLMRTGSYTAATFKGNQEAESEWFSLGASLPGISMSAESAAERIVAAVKRGDAEAILGAPANILARINGVAPGLTDDLLSFASEFLLPRGDGDRRSRPGWSIPVLRSPRMKALLFLGRMAGRRLNQRMT